MDNNMYKLGLLAGSKHIIEYEKKLYINYIIGWPNIEIYKDKDRFHMIRVGNIRFTAEDNELFNNDYGNVCFTEGIKLVSTDYGNIEFSLFGTDQKPKQFNEYKLEVSPTLFETLDETSKLSFTQGVFHRNAIIKCDNILHFDTKFKFVNEYVQKLFGGKNEVDNVLVFDSCVAFDVADKLWCDKHINFLKMLVPDLIKIKCIKKDPNAIIPSKVRITDSGLDLTAITLLKKIGDVNFYDTGISLVPLKGYYFKVYPRSSISKTGYMLANGVGVIDETYTGNLILALRKMDSSVPDLDLPCKIAQLIPEKNIYSVIEETLEETLKTSRGDGGFGSTNNA